MVQDPTIPPPHQSARTGTGIVRRFIGDPSMTVIGIERNGTNIANLVVAPELVAKLLETYGTRVSGTTTSMKALVGLRCRWEENACGMLIGLEVIE